MIIIKKISSIVGKPHKQLTMHHLIVNCIIPFKSLNMLSKPLQSKLIKITMFLTFLLGKDLNGYLL